MANDQSAGRRGTADGRGDLLAERGAVSYRGGAGESQGLQLHDRPRRTLRHGGGEHGVDDEVSVRGIGQLLHDLWGEHARLLSRLWIEGVAGGRVVRLSGHPAAGQLSERNRGGAKNQ